jgi:hypothetical protein
MQLEGEGEGTVKTPSSPNGTPLLSPVMCLSGFFSFFLRKEATLFLLDLIDQSDPQQKALLTHFLCRLIHRLPHLVTQMLERSACPSFLYTLAATEAAKDGMLALAALAYNRKKKG